MNASLIDKQTPEDVAKLAGDLLDKLVTKAVPIGRGANSRVFRLTAGGQDYVMKFYFQHPADTRDRLGIEFKSLSFLWNKGLRQIPQALNAWPQQSCALYAMIEGSLTHKITQKDIDCAVDFLKTLKGLNSVADSEGFVAASEAFFSAKEIVASLRERLRRFGFHEGVPEYQALKEYLQKDFNPLLERVEKWSKGYLAEGGISWEASLPLHRRTLSPSDFGFHNALQTSLGELVFVDFEYFGWDDPVKITSDFLWHPAMNLAEEGKQRFVNRMQDLFSDDENFEIRLKALFPIFGLKWCLIFLNEFVSSDMQRRSFAQAALEDKTAVRLNQLAKAKSLNQQISKMYKDFPYGS